jgi:soluble lytic murein transglycosylase-like protein
MSRRLLATLACASLSVSSCAVFPALPPVDAPPPASPWPAADLAARPADPWVATALEALRSHRNGLTELEVEDLAHLIVAEARRRGLDPGLVLAVIAVESRYYTYAVSPVGAIGLMQVMPATGEELAEREGIAWLGPQTLFDPFVNVRLGVAYLSELSQRYGSLAIALAAYNWGPGHIDGRLRRGTPMPEEYPRLVFEAYGERSRRSS